MSVISVTIGQKIQSLREEKNMSQKELAVVLGVSVGIVAEWEADEIAPGDDVCEKLCAALGVSCDDLFCTDIPHNDAASQEVEQSPLNEPKAKHKYLVPSLIGGLVVVIIIALVWLIFLGPNKAMSADEIYQMVSPSVVVVSADKSTGTGFFLDTGGTVVTNYHVIEKCQFAEIILFDGSKYEIDKVLGYSEERDIAILSTKCRNSVPLKTRNTEVKTGEKVYAIGTSEGIFEGTLSEGIVSSAERNLDGMSYIQFTAPISPGNSGGPLLDERGQVIGIVSASWSEGQDINFAIPISSINGVSTKNPAKLSEIFHQSVELMSDWDFFYYDDYGKYVLVFELSDEDDNTMKCSGTVEIKIVNSDGTTVYNRKHNFIEEDFEEWTIDETIDMDLATIYIAPSDITPGTSSEGKVYFTVWGEDYYFEETVLDEYDLPLKPVAIELPELPTTVTDSWSYGAWTKARIDKITYKVVDGDSLYIYFAGEKIYDYSGNNSDSSCTFGWKLYDTEGYLVDSGSVYTGSLSVGDKFKDKEAYVWDGIKPGQTYKLVLVDSD